MTNANHNFANNKNAKYHLIFNIKGATFRVISAAGISKTMHSQVTDVPQFNVIMMMTVSPALVYTVQIRCLVSAVQ